jgi:hypothetical protein
MPAVSFGMRRQGVMGQGHRLAIPGLLALVVMGAIMLAARGHEADAAQATVLRGRLHLIWDGRAGTEGAEYFVQPLDGRPATRLRVPRAIEESGRLLALDRTEVEVAITDVAGAAVRDQGQGIAEATLVSIRGIGTNATVIAPRRENASASVAALDFVTVLCRFADDPSTPFSTGSLATVHGGTSPGLAFHYREMAQDPGIMSGSVIVGWYDLPLPRSSYVFSNGANYTGIAQDCAGLAQADVEFSQFAGINVQLNGAMQTRPTPPYDVLSLGGSASLVLDGVSRVWGVTWLSGIHANNYVVVHHEVGHAIGWPHSSGNYGQEYDSRWDIMSVGYLRNTAPWGWQGVHTISSHKDARGWLPEERILEPALGSQVKGRLVRSALPPPNGYLMVRVPLPAGGWISAETRIPAGLDTPLPGSAVLLHRMPFSIRSYVIDPDSNGNPNDDAAQWLTGEEYADAVNGVSIRVDAGFADGFDVTVTRGWRLEATVVGPGAVTVNVPGAPPLECDDDCTAVAATRGLVVGVTATPDPGKTLIRWKGACTGSGACSVLLNETAMVSAEFAGPPAITTSALQPVLMGGTYLDSLQVISDGAPGNWSITSGSLPEGLTLAPSTGYISGIAGEAGEFTFTLRVSAGPYFDEQEATITVTKPVLSPGEVIESLLGGPTVDVTAQRFLDALGNRNNYVDVGDVRAWLLDTASLTPAQRAAMLGVLATRERTHPAPSNQARRP